ncbi:MAG: HAD family hydrolase, partial [Candidatus Thorarchaeota archaeon]
DLFKAIVGYRPGFEKGADHFKHISTTYGIPFESMVFVGDSLKDFERSKGFCDFIGVTGLFDSEQFHKAGHKGLLISHLNELPSLINHFETLS